MDIKHDDDLDFALVYSKLNSEIAIFHMVKTNEGEKPCVIIDGNIIEYRAMILCLMDRLNVAGPRKANTKSYYSLWAHSSFKASTRDTNYRLVSSWVNSWKENSSKKDKKEIIKEMISSLESDYANARQIHIPISQTN